MSEFRFFAYTDFQFQMNDSQSLFRLPIRPYQTTERSVVGVGGDGGVGAGGGGTSAVDDGVAHELNVPYTVFEILVAICAVIGNLMVIIVFQRERKLRRRTNYYIVSLAMADFLVGSLGVPFAILASIGLPTNLYACLFTVSLLVVLCTISIFCLVAVSVDRYWAILYPMAYSRNVRTKTAIVIISMCWVAGTVVGFLPLFGWHAAVGPDQRCLFVEVMDYDYLVFLYFATIITPALLMLAFYAHIYRVIVKQVRQIVTMNPVGDLSRRSSTAQIQQTTPARPCHGGTMLRVLGASRKRDVKATQNLSIIVLFFMICWFPLYTINCIKAFCPTCEVHPKLTLFCIILSHLNSAGNPVLYAYHLKDFRLALKNLILKVMGIEVEQPMEAIHRFSLASQHRLQSMDATYRSAMQPRIYIDSPIYLRQQQQALKKPQLVPKCGVVSPCLNNIHQTVAAVASVTADIERDMWNIMEASSGAEIGEVSYEFPEDRDREQQTPSTPTPPPQLPPQSQLQRQRHGSSLRHKERCDSPYSYDNATYSNSPGDSYDDVFLPSQHPASTGIDHRELQHSLIACAMREKLRSDDVDYQTMQHSSQGALADSSPTNDYELPPSAPLPPAQPQQQLQQQSTAGAADAQANSSVYVIDQEGSPRSPGNRRQFKKSLRPALNHAKTSKASTISRSYSCASDSPSPSPTKELTPTHLPNRVHKNRSGVRLASANSDTNSSGSLQTASALGCSDAGGATATAVSVTAIAATSATTTTTTTTPTANTNNNNSHNTNNLNYYTIHHPPHQHHCNSASQFHRPEKFSPLKAVSKIIFPPIVKHSSLFQLFQPNASMDGPNAASPEAPAAATATASRPQVVGSAEDSICTAVADISEPASKATPVDS